MYILNQYFIPKQFYVWLIVIYFLIKKIYSKNLIFFHNFIMLMIVLLLISIKHLSFRKIFEKIIQKTNFCFKILKTIYKTKDFSIINVLLFFMQNCLLLYENSKNKISNKQFLHFKFLFKLIKGFHISK